MNVNAVYTSLIWFAWWIRYIGFFMFLTFSYQEHKYELYAIWNFTVWSYVSEIDWNLFLGIYLCCDLFRWLKLGRPLVSWMDRVLWAYGYCLHILLNTLLHVLVPASMLVVFHTPLWNCLKPVNFTYNISFLFTQSSCKNSLLQVASPYFQQQSLFQGTLWKLVVSQAHAVNANRFISTHI